MRFLSARRALSAGIVAVASVAALAAPGAAQALPGHCKAEVGTKGAGSSLQFEAQVVWDPAFNANKAGCPLPEKIEYIKSSSGKGLAKWKTEKLFGEIGFVGTDNTVNATEKSEVEAEVDPGQASKVLTIPVLQGAVAIPVNLPANCKATSSVAAGRLALDQSTLEGIFKGDITTWKQVTEAPGTGNKLEDEGGTCETESPISVVVRKDKSGTTHIFKKFLNEIDPAVLTTEAGSRTWAQLAEGDEADNLGWPTAAKVVHAAEESGTGLLKEVAAKPGSIGYANLADARNVANGGFTGQSPQRFWVELEASHKEKKGEIKSRKYTDPATNGDVAASAESNCKKTVYRDEGGTFPPPSAEAPWNEVTASTTSKTYALCGLTYDLVLTNYSAYATHGGNEKEAQVVKDFEEFVLSKKGGETVIKGHDYLALPKGAVLANALAGVAKITD